MPRDGSERASFSRHFNETETSRDYREHVADDLRRLDIAKCLECFHQRGVGNLRCEIADEDVHLTLERLQIDRGRHAVPPAFHLVGDFLLLRQGAKSGTLHSRDVHENILRTIVRLNETEALAGVEPLNSTSRHCYLQVSST